MTAGVNRTQEQRTRAHNTVVSTSPKLDAPLFVSTSQIIRLRGEREYNLILTGQRNGG